VHECRYSIGLKRLNAIRRSAFAPYTDRMLALRLSALLPLATLATAQQTSVSPSPNPSISEPKLPAIDDKACPGKDRTVRQTKIVRPDEIYSSRRDKPLSVGELKSGDEVTVLAGVNVIREPDRAVVKHPGPDLAPLLKPGDVVLRYGLHADGDSDFWAMGVWFTESYEQIIEKGSSCGFADKTLCTVEITKNGVKEWWVQVKTAKGVTGWVLASKRTEDKLWDDPNFSDLCMLD
jgi:hypothetical protein